MSELNKLWISDDRGQLGTIELNTNTVTVIGSMGVIMFDIAWSPSGELWGVDSSSLYKIDPNNAQARAIGYLGGFVNALTFNQDGTLYAAGGNCLYTVNTITRAATLMGNLPVSSGGHLAFVNNELYLSTTNSDLYKVNISDPPSSSRIGSFGVANIYGIAATSANNVIYGVGDGHRVVKVDLATGVATLAFAYGGGLGEAYGMAFRKESIVDPNPEIEIPPKLKGQFEVPAISPEGVVFTNPTDKEVLIEFSPSGEWSFKPGKKTTAAGILHPEEPLLGELKYPNLPAYALVVFDKLNRNIEEVGTKKTIRLKPGQTLTFLKNDETVWYCDNSGSITVAWSVLS
jgi:hypothetical protein